jgi:predicted site-specific integrase-resolvase
MNEPQREWVSIKEAAETVGIPMTTIRDWSRFGAIETKELPGGRVVNMQQVREKAMGPAVAKRPSDLQDRVADQAPERSAGRRARDEDLTRTLLDLQELARQRHP